MAARSSPSGYVWSNRRPGDAASPPTRLPVQIERTRQGLTGGQGISIRANAARNLRAREATCGIDSVIVAPPQQRTDRHGVVVNQEISAQSAAAGSQRRKPCTHFTGVSNVIDGDISVGQAAEIHVVPGIPRFLPSHNPWSPMAWL